VAGLSQAQVAEQLGITQHAYAYWERNPVALRPEQLVQLAAALHTRVEELVCDDAAKRRNGGGGPSGKARQLFEAVSKLPRRQQEKIFAILEPFVREHANQS
jgi:transcriptional regulator with XRE-family HTH domain